VIAKDLLSKLFAEREERAAALNLAVDRYLNGMTLEELAEEMNMSRSGIRKRLRRMRAELARVSE
jgi:DNA-directed RNA polymerase specialized sigma24 family protein